MSTKPWFKCYPSDFLRGVAHLTPNELALYTIALMEMYDTDGPIPDKIEWLARRCNMRPTTCEKALGGLLEAGKLTRENDTLINERAQNLMKSRRKVGEKSKENISKRWNKSEETANKINGSDANPYQKPDTEPIPTRSQKLELDKTPAPTGAPPKKRGKRLSDDWVLPTEWHEMAVKEGLSADRIVLEATKFKNYWLAKPGSIAVKLDWKRTWHNWILNDHGQKPNPDRKSPHDKMLSGFLEAARDG